MHPGQNRMGLGMNHYPAGQGPPIGSLPPSNPGFGYPLRPGPPGLPPGPGAIGSTGAGGPEKLTTVFVGSISAGVPNEFLTSLFAACGTIRSFTRNTAANGKLQGFGFVEFESPEAVARALKFLHNQVLSAQEPDQPNKPLVVRADDKVKAHLQAFESSRIRTDQDELADQTAETLISSIISQSSRQAIESGRNNAETSAQAAVPQHLRDLTEADLPENQRGLVISEIALFRERATSRGRPAGDVATGIPPAPPSRSAGVGGFTGAGGMATVPSGPKPKERVWGKRNEAPNSSPVEGPRSWKGYGNGPQGYHQSPDFVKGAPAVIERDVDKTDEELERERRAERKREEDDSFRDRERRWESREKNRISNTERIITRVRMAAAAQARDAEEMKERLHVWDDDESDELFYADRPRWRASRARFLKQERSQDEKSRLTEERQAEHLRQESEMFLAKQMEEMQSLAEEQRKAGKLLLPAESGGLKLNIGAGGATASDSTASGATASKAKAHPQAKTSVFATAFGADEDDEDGVGVNKKKATLVKIDFGGIDADSKKERLEKIRASIKTDKESLFKHKIRWDGITDQLIDRKLEKLVRSLMIKYLGELDDDDMVMFVVEHLKDHKPPGKIVDGLEPVLLEEAAEFTISLWRQLVFESVAYGEGFETDEMLVE